MRPMTAGRTTVASSSISTLAKRRRSKGEASMKNAAWVVVGLASFVAGTARADPALRVQFSQRGDMVWFGNTSAQECASTARLPVVGTIINCGSFTSDSAPDIFWRADDPGSGEARARTQNTAADARSTAMLTVPAGATIAYARLYWAAQLSANRADTIVTLERPNAFTTSVSADTSRTATKTGFTNVYWYQSTADVTDIVKSQGVGPYRLSGIDSVNLGNLQSSDPVVAWAIVVFYRLDSDPLRNLALFDGLDFVENDRSAAATLSGFQVPNAGFDAKLAVLAYEGDFALTGDSLVFAGHPLSDGVNPVDNFFNGSRSFLGNPVSVAGDLPQMDGMAASMSGLDLDVVDITPYVAAGQTSATIQATSSGDTYMIGALATSIATYQPEFGTAVKSYADLNGGLAVPGDILEYTVVATNTGNDTAVDVVMTDAFSAGITYLPGTIQITTGANSSPPGKTDQAGDDQAEYDVATRTITVRLGTGANATEGGTIAVGESSTIKFQVRIDATASATISNQALITARGVRGNPATVYPTGNGTPGNPTTTPIAWGDGGHVDGSLDATMDGGAADSSVDTGAESDRPNL